MRIAVVPFLILFLLTRAALAGTPDSAAAGKPSSTRQSKEKKSVEQTRPVAVIETSMGTIEVDLYAKEAPKTVANFTGLAGKGYYNGVIFHRVISNFMIQGGDPTGTGCSGPGYEFEDELKGNPLIHASKVISMANAGPNTNGSQFFITHSPQPHLNGRHTVFGKVVKGQEVVDLIRQGDAMVRVSVGEK